MQRCGLNQEVDGRSKEFRIQDEQGSGQDHLRNCPMTCPAFQVAQQDETLPATVKLLGSNPGPDKWFLIVTLLILDIVITLVIQCPST